MYQELPQEWAVGLRNQKVPKSNYPKGPLSPARGRAKARTGKLDPVVTQPRLVIPEAEVRNIAALGKRTREVHKTVFK